LVRQIESKATSKIIIVVFLNVVGEGGGGALCLEVPRKTCISARYVHSREILCLQVQQQLKCIAELSTVFALCPLLHNITLRLVEAHEVSRNHTASTLPDTAGDNPAFFLPS
jgi:hypothetical protein